MSTFDQKDINPNQVSSPFYTLAIKNSTNGTQIKMSLMTDYYHTNSLPSTSRFLEKTLPEVLETKCFNDSNLPFDMEVKNTEIGHLFEHILLEYLCQTKIRDGHQRASFRGLTNWNWRKDPKGTFHITIDTKPKDIIYFEYALEKSIELLNKILALN